MSQRGRYNHNGSQPHRWPPLYFHWLTCRVSASIQDTYEKMSFRVICQVHDDNIRTADLYRSD